MREERIVVERAQGPEPRLFVRRSERPLPGRPAVIVCPGYIQNRRAFELPGRSFLDHLAHVGFCVYALEMNKHVPGGSGFVGYAEDEAAAAVRYVGARHERVGWIGHSMGGLIGVGLPSEVARELFAIVTIGSPLAPGFGHFAFEGLERVVRTAAQRLDRRLPFSGARIARGFRVGRVLMDRRWARYPLQVWVPGSLAEDELLWSLQNSFTDDSWAAMAEMLELSHTRGERAGGVPFGARVRALTTPLLVIGGDRDGLAPRRSVEPLFELAGSPVKERLHLGKDTVGTSYGHIDLLIGKHAPLHVWAPCVRFLHEHR